jgi:hypothetical protein
VFQRIGVLGVLAPEGPLLYLGRALYQCARLFVKLFNTIEFRQPVEAFGHIHVVRPQSLLSYAERTQKISFRLVVVLLEETGVS